MPVTATPATIDFAAMQIVPPPVKMEEFVTALVKSDENACDDKRSRQRYHLTTAIPAIRLDDRFQPMGEAFIVMTRDISTSGISLVHTEAIDSKNLAVELTGAAGQKTQLALQVMRCRPLDEYYEIGGKLVCKLLPPTA